jgi:hypothetical protein
MKALPSLPKGVNVTGMFIGVYLTDGQPVLFQVEDVLFLPIFSTPEKFEEAMEFAGVAKTCKIQLITDHAGFMESVIGKVRLMLDPWINEKGNTRFTELRADVEEN